MEPAQCQVLQEPLGPLRLNRRAMRASFEHLILRLRALDNEIIRLWEKLRQWNVHTARVPDEIREREVTAECQLYDSTTTNQRMHPLADPEGGFRSTEQVQHGQAVAVALEEYGPPLPPSVPNLHIRDVETSPRPRGLRNWGSSCYMNSMLQVLHGTPSFRRALQEALSLSLEGAASCTSSDRCTTIAYELQGLFQQMDAMSEPHWSNGYGVFDLVDPGAFIAAWQLHRGACDSALFFTRLMEALDGALGTHATTPFTISSAFVFEDANDPTVRLERMNPGALMLQVDSECLESVQAGLDGYFAAEQVMKTLQGSLRQCHRRTWLLTPLPSTLVIQLNQPHPPMWDYGYRYQKRRRDVTQIPDTLDLASYVWPTQPSPCAYELTGVVVHSCYHYYAFVRRDGRWWKCNDALVTEVTAREVHEDASGANLVSKALLLLYSHRPEPQAQAINDGHINMQQSGDMMQTRTLALPSSAETGHVQDGFCDFEPEL